MYVVHLDLTSASCPSPTRTDAQRIQDGLWAHASPDLGIEHIRVRARHGHVDVILFYRSTIHGVTPDERAALSAVRNLPPLRTWHVTLKDYKEGENNEEWRDS
jgi:hypothetical protein